MTRLVEHRETVRGATVDDLHARAAALAATGCGSAIVALADMGVSPATTLLAGALEDAGVPTVLLTAEPGHTLARAVAALQAGPLCLCPLAADADASPAEVEAAVDAAFETIVAALTLDAGTLAARATADPPLDAVAPAADGRLRVARRGAGPDAGDDLEAVLETFHGLRIGDGLPVVPPTSERLERMLAWAPWDPGHVLVERLGPAGARLTVRDAALAAIMAGARPEHLPIVVTALAAMAQPAYNLLQAMITSHHGGNLVLVSGPLAREVGLHGGPGCLGPGFVANAAVGRAVNLALLNVGRAVPGVSDLSCLGSPAEWTYCFAEDPDRGPWPTLNVERFDAATTAVLVLKAEPPHGVMDFRSRTAEGLLETLVDCCTSLGSNNAYVAGSLVLVLAPDHARRLARAGWDKPRLRAHVHARAGRDLAHVATRGIAAITPRPDAAGFVRATRGPDDVHVVVAGGRGGHSAVIRPWALASEAVVVAVLRPDGRTARSITDFLSTR